ncbi:helix-turn-helix domain-containing protein [Rhizobium sp. LjRoot258]|uniref:helix-turn-helix domain-containing protein n=1 Tax=Rhizobium sp. LjRoot258 TaxID=3342299 RepID=UPI003ECEAD11
MPESKKKVARGAVVYPRVERVLQKIGDDISLARRVRKITVDDFATRIGISRATLHRLEKGDPGVGLNTLAMALHALGRLDAFANIADPSTDHVTMMQMRDQAPKRISKRRIEQTPRKEAEGTHEAVVEGEASDSKYVGF